MGFPKVEPNPAMLVTILAIVLLELKAPRHKLYGFAPTTFPLYLFLALIPGSGVGVAMASCLVALTLRTFLAGRKSGNIAMWELVVDGVSVGAALAVIKLLHSVGPQWSGKPVVALFAAGFLHFMLRPILHNAWASELEEGVRKSWEIDQVSAATLLSLCSFLAIFFGFLSALDGSLAFALPIIPFLLGTAISPLLDAAKDYSRIREGQSQVQNQAPPQVKKDRGDVTLLDLKDGDFSFLASLADSLEHGTGVEGILEEALRLCHRVASADNTVIFLEEQARLDVVASKSSHQEELDEALARGVSEPMVRRCLETNRTDFLRGEDTEFERLFEKDSLGVAVPIGRRGVIYLGRHSGAAFTDDEVSRLGLLAQQSHLALKAAQAVAEKERSMAHAAEGQQASDNAYSGINSASKIMKELLGSTSAEDLLERAGSKLGQLFSNDYWSIIAGKPNSWPPEFQISGPPSKPKTEPTALLEIAEVTMQKAVPLLEGALKDSELPQPSKGTRSILTAPLFGPEGPIGTIILCNSKSDAYSKRDKELLTLIGHQLGARLMACLMPNAPVDASQELEVARAQLVQSSKMAAVGQLAAGVAHELNTPLGALQIAVEGALKALDKDSPEKAESRLKKGLLSAHQLKKIVAKLLFYSRDVAIEEKETDLNEVIERTLELVGNQLALDDIEFETQLGEVDMVLANQNEIQQVVINLLTNAKDAVLARPDDGPKRITLTTSDHARAVELAVEDTGIGMDEETRKKIFQPFFTTKEAGKGTGLGLSVTKELVEKHGGAVRVTSNPIEGTRFVLRLPKVRR